MAGTLHERTTESSVTSETTLMGQLLCTDGLSGSDCLLIAIDEMVDAQIVNIGIVRDAMS